MAHGFLAPVGDSEATLNLDLPYKKLFNFLKDNLWRLRKQQENIAVRVSEIQNTLEGRNQKALPPGTRMLSGKDPKGLISSGGPTALPPGGPRLPGDTGPIGPKKGGTITNLSGNGGINADTFFKRAQTGVGADGTYMTSAQRKEAFIKSRQERVKESVASAAAVSKSPEISVDKSSDVVAAVNKNTEAVLGLVKVTKEQTVNDTKLSEKAAVTQEKIFSRQRAAAEESSLEKGSDLSGFLKPEMKKIEKKMGAGPGGQGYSGQLGGGGPNVMDMLDIGSDILDMRKGKVRRITQGRDGRTSRQRLRDMKARKAGLRPSSRGVRPRGGGLARTGGSALGRGAGLGKALAGGAKGGGGLLKGAAMAGKATRGIPGLGLLTAGLEFGDRKAQGQSNLQAGVGTAGSVGGGLAGAAAGAAIGSVVPILGTAAGALIGGLLGSMAGGGIADAATGANNVTPMASGGVLVGEAGLEGVFPLSGKEGKKTFAMFGQGLFDVQMDNKEDYAKLQSAGLKQYYEKEGGFEKMGGIFEGISGAIGGLVSGLGSVLSALAGGSASAATMGSNFAGSMSADEQQLTEALIAAEEGLKTEAYQDTEGIWTIGYGQTTLNGRAVKQGDKISKEEALTGFRSNVKSHAQRAINQVGEKRWQELDPKARAVLTSLAYNYGSIPSAVLPAAKSGSTEDIAKSMDALYGHNRGVLKKRRQREQSILRGNLQGSPGNTVRLDKDFMAGGKFAGAGTGPMIAGGATAGPGGKVIEYITGDKTSSGYRADHGGGNYHDHVAFDSKASRDAASAFLKTKGWKIGSMNDGRHADGSYHYSDQAFDIPFYPNQRIKGVTDDAKGETKLSSMLRKDLAAGGFSGSGVPAVPGQVPGPMNSPIAGIQMPQTPAFNIPGAPELSNILNANAAPTPVAATPAAANTGAPMMTTSAQVAMAGTTQAAPTVINNYNIMAGAGGGGGVVGNTLVPGIGMDSTGLSAFQQLKLRSIG